MPETAQPSTSAEPDRRARREAAVLARIALDEADVVQRSMGAWGKWHFWVCFAIYMVKFSIAWHQINIVIEGPAAKFTCKDNSDKCAKNCSEHIFDRSVFTETIITEWDLVCDRHILGQLAQTVTMLGILFGNVIFGYWSDKSGRKHPLVYAVIIQVISGTMAAFVPWFWALLFLRFISALATGGTMVTSFVLILELVGRKWRCAVATLYQVPFNMGHLLLAPIGYIFRNWRHQQLAISLPNIVLISYFCILPESPRWLTTTGRIEEAIKTLEWAAKVNKLPTEPIRADITTFAGKLGEQTKGAGNIVDLVRTKNMAMKTFGIGLNWLSTGLCFYGVAQYAGRLAGNIFINIALTGAIQIPGTVMSIFFMETLGRRNALILSNLIAGVSMLIIPLIPRGHWVVSMLAVIAMFGLGMLWGNVYMYSGELFPTVIRNVGCGVTSMMCRFGSVIAPFVSTLDTTSVGWWLSPVIFGVVPLCAACVALTLPETLNTKLPDTLEEAEAFGKRPPRPV